MKNPFKKIAFASILVGSVATPQQTHTIVEWVLIAPYLVPFMGFAALLKDDFERRKAQHLEELEERRMHTVSAESGVINSSECLDLRMEESYQYTNKTPQDSIDLTATYETEKDIVYGTIAAIAAVLACSAYYA